ncbi:E3 ubiquitin-protein ligase rnf213-alpha [Kryptolebias marmoratus]|uniref:E3 ubiquitin-protein ligase rnf213-alpha n=1 Tax=Kryptolebias marmoratus TaxID=37003 RepID=UPI0007F8662F|nr:E3 ubiquitin-protein ligase rnf213-alpha [Kryptolebias marmoratus]XP_017280868.1 E3 ubiquitin-protein ligase rnf213-alpha [Kryptolebias marmoratus]XP_017280869.1 E3 ubiquitin-protein ligase rnf213-alpha [Kryptolebias marmoratus]
MKCPSCGHNISEKGANFCSKCGSRLSGPPANTHDAENQPKPLVAGSESRTEQSESQKNVQPPENKESNMSPKRPNDEQPNPKKKKKKRKKNKKKKDGHVPSDQDQSQSDRSLVSLEANQKKTCDKEDPTDSESSDVMEDAPDSLQDDFHSLESEPGSLKDAAASSEITQVTQSEKPPCTDDATAAGRSEEAAVDAKDGESDAQKSAQDQTVNAGTAEAPAQPPTSKTKKTSQSGSAGQTKLTDAKEQTTAKKDQKNNNKSANSAQSSLDRGANFSQNAKETGETQLNGKNQEDQKQKGRKDNQKQKEEKTQADQKQKEEKTQEDQKQKLEKTQEDQKQKEKKDNQKQKEKKDNQKQKEEKTQQDQKQKEKKNNQKQKQSSTPSKADNSGSSVDPENMEVEESGDTQKKTPDGDRENDEPSEGTSSSQTVEPPKRLTQNKNIAARNRLTIYFHAVLSKDFKFNPDEDLIFIRAGSPIGTWEKNVAELTVSRDLGEHGFLVEGILVTSKTETVTKSIPYKYVVYKYKKKAYEFEYIYKLESSKHHTNRCLFVKNHLITDDGDWHQYDDIICAEPSKNVLKRLKETIWPDQRKSLIQGREIAGFIMLENIFDLLRSWSDTNLRSFQIQLNQFFQVYGNPFVFEEKGMRWHSLQFGEDEVRKMLKEFMLTYVVPQLRDGEAKNLYIQDPLRAAVIMLHVMRQYQIKLENSELHRLCKELCLPKLENDSFLQYWMKFSQDVLVIQTLPETLVHLIKIVKKEGMPRWIMVLPLLHLLKGSVKPFEVKTSGNMKYGPSWAGLEGLDIGNFSYTYSQDRRALLNVMTANSHLMKVDALSVRSCLYLMPLEDLMECNINIKPELLDMLIVFYNKVPQDITSSNSQSVTEILFHIQEHLIQEKYSYFTEAYRKECLTMSVRLLEKICRGVKPLSYTQNFPDIPIACMNLVASVSNFFQCDKEQEGREDKNPRFAKDLISQGMGIMRDWMTQSLRQSLLSGGLTSFYQSKSAEMEIWNNLISINFKDEEYTKEWRQIFTLDFEGKYKRETALDQIEFYCTNIEKLSSSHPHVAASIEKCALEAVTSLCQTRSEGKLFERFKINWKFGTLISAIIEKSWPRDNHGNYQEDEEVVLRHLLSWTAAKDIFQLHGAEQKLIEKLSQDARDRLAIAISSFTAINCQLIQGDININLLNIILGMQDAFLELLKIDCLSEEELYKDKDKMNTLLQHRRREVKAVYHEKELVEAILTMCHKLEEHMTVDVADLEVKTQVNIETMPLDHFMVVNQFDQLASDPLAGIVTYFNLDEEIRDMAKELFAFKDSYVFKIYWEKRAIRLAMEEKEDDESDEDGIADIQATPDMIYNDIYLPCFHEYKAIYTDLKKGSIRIEVIRQLFGLYKDKYADLTKELDIMCKLEKSADKQWIHIRVEQVKQYHELHLAVASARVIMKVKETLGLHGDFKVLETLMNVIHADFQKEPISRIDNDLMQAKMVLVDITESRRQCLEELGLRGHFVRWVKDSLEDINELKVFVDLASISAGENDMDVDRVACFHDAVLGYGSVLYELKPDSGFRAFKEVLNKLWRAFENDNNLPKKLRDSSRHLEWLKTVKDSHGSVELSSLSLASTINNKGIYLINAQNVKQLTLESALKLQIPEEHDEYLQMRSYSLEDLRELQNKLMLMSGKGDQGQNEVDHFVEVFASVQRLTEAFIALYSAGNPLFRHWEVQINCSSSSYEPSIVMDFNLDSFCSVVVEGSIEEQLPELCRKMEKCLDYWMDFVNKQRSYYYFLNYYTAEQIVYLCSKLIPQNVTSVEDQVLMMLSFIKPNCTSNDLRQVWHTLQYENLTRPQEQNEDLEFQTFVVVSGSELEEPDMIGNLDSLHSLFEKAKGLQAFDQIWNAYMKDMRSFLPNIVDMKTLGRLLEKLANIVDKNEEDDSEEDISEDNFGNLLRRQLPKGLEAGKPNLIVCPHNDVLTSCISIYMSSENEALPTYDEVLLCNPSTPYEQVELFLRRCLSRGYGGQKIYTLVYGDLLTYDVSSKVENFFQRIKMQSRKDYRLVVICSSEREHSYLPSAFSQYRLHMIPQEPLARIQTYLQKHYTVPEEQCSAAAAFKDRLCVGVVSSKRAGVGKSLYIKRLYEKLKHSTKKQSVIKCIRLIEPNIDETVILKSLLDTPKRKELAVFHFDITSSVQKGLHEFLFKLLILRYLMDSEGKMWRCNTKQLYVMEILEPTVKSTRNTTKEAQTMNNTFIDVFPNIFCRPPKDVLMLEMRKQEDPTIVSSDDPLMDDEEFRSEAFQRPYQYLKRFHNHADLDVITYQGVEGSHVECLQMLLMYCGIMDPSWAELRNFTWFLNLQLKDCETSVFCDATFTGDTLSGFKTFVVDFMILMAKDFATPSLSISDQSPGRSQVYQAGVQDEDLAPFLIRKRWETEPHPYIFFNDDHVSMTFIGFHLQLNEQNSVDAIEPTSKRVIKKNVMTRALYEGLQLQRVPFNVNFDNLPRWEKIERICRVLGIQWPLDPDETYELTTDNILKMLAIHMRFRCGIPVIVMGETGCGKTRLIKFLCELQRSGVATENMKLVKVHGGTTSEMIYTKVIEAENIAAINKQDYGFDSVLFFDEANTTEAISSIKEVLCDKTVKGESLTPCSGLQIIAACNPYRKHTDEMIQRLESAGLGYRVRAEETDEKLGSIPLRQLVYRVQALPPSMIPLVWDFGQLNDHTEKIYIQQIVQRVIQSKEIDQTYIMYITDVLSASQKYMRTRNDECSFVSLRDVERCMQAFVWFLDHHEMFFSELQKFEKNLNDEGNEGHQRQPETQDPILWSLVMAIGVCYHACLENKDKYRQKISKQLPPSYTPSKLIQEISLMQDLLLSGVPMGETIARNNALKENVFMMVLCIELRIPLFLVGKPGSSKSLSKTLVADAMQGQAAHSDLYKMLKQIHLVSFQCSPHSTPEGIISTFKQCGRFQEGKNLNEYISVVVLDEIGLAEDSPKMPLKTLHPLLEEGCIDDEPLPHKKVGFIGISNWALDPAKMNRGIFVSRGDPDEKELIESAKGICSSDVMVLEKVRDFFKPFARSYLKICHKQGKGFFGLRDYYSLIKMIFAVARTSQQKPTAEEIVKAVLRNFSGKDNVDVVSVFTQRLQITPNLENISAIEFVKENIQAVGQEEECRYLLVLTKNYAALQILQQTFFSESGQPEIIFGSSFPKDQEYTQICRNINRVKICMETGQTVVLLNLQNLYESLYDALNQYYVCLGGQKYVDLGLGTHRVKCRVHKDFRLIVIEEREVVYKQFPIPLINRLEKHYLDIHTVLKTEQKKLVEELERWAKLFASLSNQHAAGAQMYKYQLPDVFIGYHSDTCASVVLQVIEEQKDNLEISDSHRGLLDEAKLILLKCATPDSVVRLDCTGLPKVESKHLAKVYFEEQNNSCLAAYIQAHTRLESHCSSFFTEVTTFSRLLTAFDMKPLEQMFHSVELLSLQQFDTEHSFLKKIRNFLTAGKRKSNTEPCNKILIIQCDFDEASHSANLIASAKYSSINEINKITQESTGSRVFVYFITRLPRMEGGTSYIGFHGGPWRSVHIDDLRRSKDIISDIKTLQNMTISQMFEAKAPVPEAMEVDDMYIEAEEERAEESGLDDVIDTTSLLRSCVQSAVSMLSDHVKSGFRSTRRVAILLTLLSDNDEIKGEFLQTLKKHLHSLLVFHDGNTLSSIKSNWVLKEASSIDALQEGGTFRHTLWKRVQAVIVPLLAQLVSIIDRDQNMNLLLDANCCESVKRLWLDVFSNEKLLQISHLTMDHSFEARTILVQNYIAQDENMGCTMPFSWRIKDFLEEFCVHVLQNEGHTQLELVEFFWKTPLGSYIAKANSEIQMEFYHRYLQDFISMSMNITCPEDLQLLCGALNCCVTELRLQLNDTEPVPALPWVHAAYHKFKNRLQNLLRMMCIEPQVTKDLLGNPHAKDNVELVLDVYAAFACLEHLEPRVLDTDAQRQAWLRQVKKLQVPIELICSEDSVRYYGERSKTFVSRVQSGWNRIISLSLFVEHMLLGIEELDKKLSPVVLDNTRRLGQILEKNSDLKSQQIFKAVIGLLKACKDGAVDRIFKFGLVLCPVCMGDPQDPLCLACEHIYCVVCIKQWLIPGQMYCPLCMQQVDDDFPLVPSDDIRVLVSKHALFRKRYNAFFIDLVSTVCFKDNSPPCPAVILILLSFLMVEANTVPILKANRQMLTKVLSPFDDSVDKNPVIRSVVLKLLLKYSFDDVKEYLQQHLMSVEQSNILEEADKTELYCMYINCLEDSMFERLQFRSVGDQQAYLRDESAFLTDYLQSHGQRGEKPAVQYLQQLARVRMDLDVTASLIVDKLRATGSPEGGQSRSTAFLDVVVNLCRSGNDWYRVYLIRKICSQHGVEFVMKLLKQDQMRWLFPKEVQQQNEDTSPIDQYLVCGEDYKTIREAVAKINLEGKVERLDEVCEGCKCLPQQKPVYLLLALYREITTLYGQANESFHPKPEQLEALTTYIQSSKVLASAEMKGFALALVTNRMGPLVIRPGVSGARSVAVELAIHLAAVLICGNQGFLAPLQQLALTPANMQASFLPTMPEDMVTVAQQALGPLRWYCCPNGHPCTIGECGQPMQTSRCVDCGIEIGGNNHRAVQGFQILPPQGDRTQTGHILGDPGRRDNPDMLDTKSISPVPFTIVRMLTHMAMLLGACNHTPNISAIIKPPVADPAAFLLAHLKKDVQQLIRSLGKGTDDAISTIHLLISSLLQPHQQQRWPVPYNNQLATKESRNGWEMEMSNTIISPQLKHLDRQLKEVNAFIRDDSRISANPIMKLVFGEPRLFLASIPPNSLIHCSAVWSCREKVSLLSLTHIVEQNDGKDVVPVLWRFLHREAEVQLVKHLPDILTLQKDLVKKFQNITELTYDTIADFLQSHKGVSIKTWYERHIRIFLTTWNQLRVSLETNGEIKIPAEFCQKDLDLNSDFKVLLPQRQGAGLCSTALVSYLIALHNDLIYCVDKHTGEETSYKVSPADLTDLHVIRYELERDVMPLVLSNTQYSIERGQETLHEYDLPKIQQQIISRFLLGKPLITLNGIPTLVNRHDRNYEIIFKDIMAKVKQEPLQTLTLFSVAGELHSYSEVCEALSTLEVALGFLAMTGGEPHMQLSTYLEEVLQMGNQMAQHIIKAFSMCCLKHCVALWQLLASLKSENMLRLKRDPFEGVSKKYKQALGEDEHRLLTGFFSKSSADTFLLEMHEFLVLVLKKPNAPDTYNPDWSLKDTLVSYMERKDLDIPPDVEELFPEEICLSHYTEAWKFIVTFKQERAQRQ